MPKRGQTLKSGARELIIKLQDYFERERQNGGPLVPVEQVQERVSQALGVSKRTITNINKEKFGSTGMEDNILRTPKKKRRTKPVTDIDTFDADAIRNHIYGYYSRNEYLNRKKLLASLREAGLFSGGKTALTKILKDIGFSYKKTDKRKILLERYDIILKRISFLREAKKIDNWDNVVFIDETWLNANHTVSRSWTDDTQASTLKVPMGKGARLIICHAGSAKYGFVENALLAFQSKTTNDYHEEMNATTFKEWFQNVLLPSLPEPSVIFMDNASYHSVQIQKPPTQANKKEEMVAWLQAKGIDANMQMLKAELIKLVKENKAANVRYEIDELALEYGHRVLRIPPYHCQYNAIELIWAQIKGYAARHNTSPPFSTKKMMTLLKEACGKVTRDDWAKVVEKTKNLIVEHFDRDIRIDSVIDNNIIIHVGEDDDEDTTSSSESESD